MKIKKIRVFVIFLLFIVYFFLAARPVPLETVLTSAWVSSLDIESLPSTEEHLIPFTLGSRFGYVDKMGRFSINKAKENNIYLGENSWAEYEAQPVSIQIKNPYDMTLVNIENTSGYPILLDNRIFIIGNEQNALSEIDLSGNVLWTYEYGAPITCIDAAAGLVLTGSLDGIIEIIDSTGKRIFNFEPGGSKYGIILGCAISANGSRLAVICGVDQMRFLFLERSGTVGGEYRVVHHEYLDSGFRRPVRILFIDQDSRIIYEQPGGLSCFNIRSRHAFFIPLNGNITAVDSLGSGGVFFLITSDSRRRNELVGIKLPEDRRFVLFGNDDAHRLIFLRASFYSDDVFLGRTGSKLIAGGGSALISFDLEEK